MQRATTSFQGTAEGSTQAQQPHAVLCRRSPFLGLGAGGGGYRHAGEGGNASSINGVSLLTSQLASVHCRPFGGFGGGGGGCGGGGGGGYSGGPLLQHRVRLPSHICSSTPPYNSAAAV